MLYLAHNRISVYVPGSVVVVVVAVDVAKEEKSTEQIQLACSLSLSVR